MPNNREPQQIAGWLYESFKKSAAKSYSSLETDTTLASNNLFCLRENLLKWI